MPELPRPTLRCLDEDLGSDWSDVHDQRALSDLDRCPPFHALRHPAIEHLVAMFSDSDAAVARESISGLTDPMWWKLKTGRWRGAVYVDDNGQVWLCAAGLRYGGEKKDFYKSFMTQVAGGPDRFLPTDDDRKRLARERLERVVSAWELSVRDRALEALAKADGLRGSSRFDVQHPTKSEMIVAEANIEVVRFADDEGEEDGIGEIVVTFSGINWEHSLVLERAEILVMAAICPDEQQWDPGFATDNRIYSVVGSLEEVERLIASADADDRVPGATFAGKVSHYSHKSRLAEHYVVGTATQALCGTYFVPRQDPEGMAVCPSCESVLKLLDPA